MCILIININININKNWVKYKIILMFYIYYINIKIRQLNKTRKKYFYIQYFLSSITFITWYNNFTQALSFQLLTMNVHNIYLFNPQFSVYIIFYVY